MVEVLAHCTYVVGSAQAQAGPGMRGNHVDHGMEDFRPVGRAALGDHIVHKIEGQASGDGRQHGEHPAVAVTEPQWRNDHGEDQGQDCPTALAEHDKHPQARQCRQPQ
ncbi:hypothetical protein D3C76_1056210 [compost metagenome]